MSIDFVGNYFKLFDLHEAHFLENFVNLCRLHTSLLFFKKKMVDSLKFPNSTYIFLKIF